MIQEFVDRFMAAKSEMLEALRRAHPESYDDLVKRVVDTVGNKEEYIHPDVDRITIIDHGDYQGTKLYIIGATGYQPRDYWSIFVSYGSCSGCDTFQAIWDYSGESPTESQVRDYWTLMLHMVQSMRQIEEGWETIGDSD